MVQDELFFLPNFTQKGLLKQIKYWWGGEIVGSAYYAIWRRIKCEVKECFGRPGFEYSNAGKFEPLSTGWNTKYLVNPVAVDSNYGLAYMTFKTAKAGGVAFDYRPQEKCGVYQTSYFSRTSTYFAGKAFHPDDVVSVAPCRIMSFQYQIEDDAEA